MTTNAVLMPDLSRARHGFRHTVDSALDALFDLGISPERITLEMDGCGLPTECVGWQSPVAGTPLTNDQAVVLGIAGAGVFYDLPAGMWDRGGDREPGTAEVISLFDDPLQKMAHWVRDGERLFEIRRKDLSACARWLSLFGIAAGDWPEDLHYALALVLPSVHRLAGTETGMRFLFSMLLQLPVFEIRRRPRRIHLTEDQQSRLGMRKSRLGIDLFASNCREDLSVLQLVFGPVTLATYRQYQRPFDENLIRAVLDLAVPCYQPVDIGWQVLDERCAPRLGLAEQNGVLGVNMHLGAGWMPPGEREFDGVHQPQLG